MTAKREDLSGYYLTSIVSSDYGVRTIALPEKQWTKRFATLTSRQLANQLRACAKHGLPVTVSHYVAGDGGGFGMAGQF